MAKKSYWKFVAGFLGIIVVIAGGFFVWNGYLSPTAKSQRQMEKQYEAYMEWEKRHLDALKQDIFGGKTSEETLKMFIEALEKEDIELASKYFALDVNENSEYYLTRRKWEDGLRKAKEDGKIGGITESIKQMKLSKRDTGSQDVVEYVLLDIDGIVNRAAILKFNKYSNIWKIESL